MDPPSENVEDKAPRKPPHNKEAWIQATDQPPEDPQQENVHTVTVGSDIAVVPSDWLERTATSVQNVWQAATSTVQVWPGQHSPHSPGVQQHDGIDQSSDVLPLDKQWMGHTKSSPQPPMLKRILSDHSIRQQSSFQNYMKSDDHVKMPSSPETLYENQGQMMDSITTDWTEGSRVFSTTIPVTYSTSSPVTYLSASSGPYSVNSRSYPGSPGPYSSVSVSYSSTNASPYPTTEPSPLLSMEKIWSTVPQTVGTIFKNGSSSPQVSASDLAYLQQAEASPSNQNDWVVPSSSSSYKDIQNTLVSAFVNPKDENDTMWVGLSRHGISITPEQEQLQEYFSRNAVNVIRDGEKKDAGLIWNQSITNETNCEVYSESLDGLVSYDKRPNVYPHSVNLSPPDKSVHKHHGKDSLDVQVPESSSKLMSSAGTQTMYTLPKVQYIHVHPPKSAAQKVAGQILLSTEDFSSNHRNIPSPNQGAFNQNRVNQTDQHDVHHGTADSPQPVLARSASDLNVHLYQNISRSNVSERTDNMNQDRYPLENFPRKIVSSDSPAREFLILDNAVSVHSNWQKENMELKGSIKQIHNDQQETESQVGILKNEELKTNQDVVDDDDDDDDGSSEWSQSSDEDLDYLSCVCSICGKQLIHGGQDKSEICNTCKLVRSVEKITEEKLPRSPRTKCSATTYKSTLDEIKAENKRGRKSCKPKKLWVQSSAEEMSVAAAAKDEADDVKPPLALVTPKEENSNFSEDAPLSFVRNSEETETLPAVKRKRGRPKKSESKGKITLQRIPTRQRLKTVEPAETSKDEDTSDDEGSKRPKQGKRKSVWRCRLCGSTYALQSQLTHHRQSVCTKRKCPECGVRFANKSKLARHMRSHSGLKPFACNLCGKSYGDRGSLNAHNASHEGAKPFVCEQCGRQYTHKGSFKSHMRTHTGDKPFQCDHCGTQFSFRSSLLCHIKTHTGERPYTCDICGKTFADRSVQLRHTRSHKGDKPYQCKECGKGFTQSGTLKIHMRKHTGDKPYSCAICHQSFICRSDLNKHSRCHSADHKPSVKRSKAAPPAVVPVQSQEHLQMPVQVACQVTPAMSEVIEYTPQNMDYTTMTKMEATDSVKNLIILSSQVEEAGVQYVTNQLYRGNYVTMM